MNKNIFETDKALDVIADITPYLGELFSDEDIKKVFSDTIVKDEEETKDDFEKRINKLGNKRMIESVKILLKKHKVIVYTILANIFEKDVEEIKKQSIFVTTKQILDLLNDEDFKNFLGSQNN